MVKLPELSPYGADTVASSLWNESFRTGCYDLQTGKKPRNSSSKRSPGYTSNLPHLPQKSSPSSGPKRLPFWDSCCLNPTVSSSGKQSQPLHVSHPWVTVTDWKYACSKPGFPQPPTVASAEAAKDPRSRWVQDGTLPAVSHVLVNDAELPSSNVPERDVIFQTAHARDAAAADPLTRRVREAAEAECALVEDLEQLDALYAGVEEFVNSSETRFLYGIDAKVMRLGSELVSCINSRRRRRVGDEVAFGPSPRGDGFLSRMPRYVKRSFFFEIVREEVDKRHGELKAAMVSEVAPSPSLSQTQSNDGSACDSPDSDRRHKYCSHSSQHYSSAGYSSDGGDLDSDGQDDSESHVESPRFGGVRKSSIECMRRRSNRICLGAVFATTFLARMKHVFDRLQVDGRVHTEDLTNALNLLGFLEINDSWVQECTLSLTRFNLVNEQEFHLFVEQYKERQLEARRECFFAYDVDGSGSIDMHELEHLLHDVGIVPMKHVLKEALEALYLDETLALKFEGFCKLLDVLKLREGFAKAEYDGYLALYQRFCAGPQELETLKFAKLLRWKGFVVDQKLIDDLIQQVDVDESGHIDEQEFVSCMRLIREHEVQKLRVASQIRRTEKVARKASVGRSQSKGRLTILHWEDEDLSGTAKQEAHASWLSRMFHSLGYIPERDAMLEAAAVAGISTEQSSSKVGELWHMMQTYRAREGLSVADAKDIDDAFMKHRSRGGYVEKRDVGKVMRCAGYVINFDLLQTLAAEIDITGEGKVSLSDVKKLVRLARDEDAQLMKKEFDKLKKEGDTTISRVLARQALVSMGCTNPDGTAPDTFERGAPDVTFLGFCHAAMVMRREARALYRKNGGFSHDDLCELRKLFVHYDSDGSGDIAKEELVMLLEQLMPKFATDPIERPALIKLIQEVDTDGSGALDFQEFVRLVRQAHDFEVMARLSKETKAVDECCFELHEVQGFRDVFMKVGDGSRELPFSEIKGIMTRICPMGSKQTEEFIVHCAEVLRCPPNANTERMVFDFPDFLRLMKIIIDANFAKVRERFGLGSVNTPSPRPLRSGAVRRNNTTCLSSPVSRSLVRSKTNL